MTVLMSQSHLAQTFELIGYLLGLSLNGFGRGYRLLIIINLSFVMSDNSDHQENQLGTQHEDQQVHQDKTQEQSANNQQGQKLVNSIHSSESDTPKKKSHVSEDTQDKKEQERTQPVNFEHAISSNLHIPTVSPLKNDHEVTQSHELIGSAPISHQQLDTTAEVIVDPHDIEQSKKIQNTTHEEQGELPVAEKQEKVQENQDQPQGNEGGAENIETQEEPAPHISQQQPPVQQEQVVEAHQQQQPKQPQTAREQIKKESQHEEEEAPHKNEQTANDLVDESHQKPELPSAPANPTSIEPQIIDPNAVPLTQDPRANKAQTVPTKQNPSGERSKQSNALQTSITIDQRPKTSPAGKKPKEQVDGLDRRTCGCLLF